MDNSVFEKIGFMSGLEIHQQLKTETKLFCRCPTGLRKDTSGIEILRHMRPTLSEMGTYDRTALMEFKTKKQVHYQIYTDTICTYEIDDTPPFELNEEALDISLIIAMQLHSNIVDELHISRKQYLDGSIPAGFQRTGIVAVEGWIPYKDRKINIRQLSLEEDACREISDHGHHIIFRTDRLSIPLVEVVTEPDMKDPTEVREVANILGRIMRFTRLVRRGMGATRQDVNVSITGSVRTEIKGVPTLKLIEMTSGNDALRQRVLLDIMEELKKRGATEDMLKLENLTKKDVTHIFNDLDIEVFKKAREAEDFHIKAVKLPKFGGLLSRITHQQHDFAHEFAGRILVIACIDYPKNFLHTDELPGFGVTDLERSAIMKELKVGKDDVALIVWGTDGDTETALREIALRAQEATQGLPFETRQAFKDGTTGFERMLPGPDRMYPDTDSPPVPLTKERLDRLRKLVPEPLWDVEKRLEGPMKIPHSVAYKLPISSYYPLFDAVTKMTKLSPVRVAVAVMEDLTALRRAGVDLPLAKQERIFEIFKLIDSKKVTWDAFVPLAKMVADPGNDGKSVAELAKTAGYGPMKEAALQEIIDNTIKANPKIIEMRTLNPLMGLVMREVRGSVPGEKVYELVSKTVGL